MDVFHGPLAPRVQKGIVVTVDESRWLRRGCCPGSVSDRLVSRHRAGLAKYPNKLKYAQDWGLILKFFRHSKVDILPLNLVNCTVDDNSMTFANKYKKIVVKDYIENLKYVKINFNLNILELVIYIFIFKKKKIKLLLM